MPRIPFGLDRLPRTTNADDPRLPGVVVDADKLRLNSEALPAEAMAAASPDHAARVATILRWLSAQCGDYAAQRQRFIAVYFHGIAAHLHAHRDELAAAVQRYDGLYALDDWLWSALRPLPRAWLTAGDRLLPCDIAFWPGERAVAIDVAVHETERTAALRDAGIDVVRVAPDAEGDAVLDALPDAFKWFWRDQMLPASPFRRAIPDGVLGASGQ